jgi:hypothetical protein
MGVNGPETGNGDVGVMTTGVEGGVAEDVGGGVEPEPDPKLMPEVDPELDPEFEPVELFDPKLIVVDCKVIFDTVTLE